MKSMTTAGLYHSNLGSKAHSGDHFRPCTLVLQINRGISGVVPAEQSPNRHLSAGSLKLNQETPSASASCIPFISY